MCPSQLLRSCWNQSWNENTDIWINRATHYLNTWCKVSIWIIDIVLIWFCTVVIFIDSPGMKEKGISYKLIRISQTLINMQDQKSIKPTCTPTCRLSLNCWIVMTSPKHLGRKVVEAQKKFSSVTNCLTPQTLWFRMYKFVIFCIKRDHTTTIIFFRSFWVFIWNLIYWNWVGTNKTTCLAGSKVSTTMTKSSWSIFEVSSVYRKIILFEMYCRHITLYTTYFRYEPIQRSIDGWHECVQWLWDACPTFHWHIQNEPWEVQIPPQCLPTEIYVVPGCLDSSACFSDREISWTQSWAHIQ